MVKIIAPASICEIRNGIKEMKRNRSLKEDEVVTKAIKVGRMILLQYIENLSNDL